MNLQQNFEAGVALFRELLIALLWMQLNAATSLLTYKPEMHDSWVDPKVGFAVQLCPVHRNTCSAVVHEAPDSSLPGRG